MALFYSEFFFSSTIMNLNSLEWRKTILIRMASLDKISLFELIFALKESINIRHIYTVLKEIYWMIPLLFSAQDKTKTYTPPKNIAQQCFIS